MSDENISELIAVSTLCLGITGFAVFIGWMLS